MNLCFEQPDRFDSSFLQCGAGNWPTYVSDRIQHLDQVGFDFMNTRIVDGRGGNPNDVCAPLFSDGTIGVVDASLAHPACRLVGSMPDILNLAAIQASVIAAPDTQAFILQFLPDACLQGCCFSETRLTEVDAVPETLLVFSPDVETLSLSDGLSYQRD